MTCLSHIEVEAEGADCRSAIADLLQDNRFAVAGLNGPYRLHLAIIDGRIAFRLTAEGGAAEFHLSLGPMRQVLKDYAQICNALAEAQGRLPHDRIEAIDMARRGIHNEGARELQERLQGKAETDLPTARGLFSLIRAMR